MENQVVKEIGDEKPIGELSDFELLARKVLNIENFLNTEFIPFQQAVESIGHSFRLLRLQQLAMVSVLTPGQKADYDNKIQEYTIAQQKTVVFMNFVEQYVNRVTSQGPDYRSTRIKWAEDFLNGFKQTGEVEKYDEVIRHFTVKQQNVEMANGKLKKEPKGKYRNLISAQEFFVEENLFQLSLAIPSLNLNLV